MTTGVLVFFYGSFMNRDVLARYGFVPDGFEVARLPAYQLVMAPYANVVRSERDVVYGLLCHASHDDLRRLYAEGWVSAYQPEPVLVETTGRRWQAALCYVAPATDGDAPEADYVERIVAPAREHGFPQWYVDRLEEFRRGR